MNVIRVSVSGPRPRQIFGVLAAVCFVGMMGGASATEAGGVTVTTADTTASRDSTMKLQGGSEGTVFKSLKIEGEDRIRITFDRPELILTMDAASAPGLEWRSVPTVLDRDRLDVLAPFLGVSAGMRRSCFARPWLDQLSSDGVARFKPALEGVEKWRLVVANSKGEQVARFEGKGKPPKEIVWDGRSIAGDPVPPGLVYTYVLEAYDRAGNKKNFVGDGFEIPSYMIESPEGLMILFSGAELHQSQTYSDRAASPPPEIILEIANHLNREQNVHLPVRIMVTARTFEDANRWAGTIVEMIKPALLGDVLRLQPMTNVEPDAPEQGTVAILVAR